MKFRFSDLNADTIKKGFEHIRSTAIPEALSKARSMVIWRMIVFLKKI